MLNRHHARNVVGITGNVVSCGLFLSPWPTFWRIIRNKSVEQFKVDPYLATVLNCIFWILYGLPFVRPDSTLVVTTNGAGLVLELIYLTIYFIYSENNGRKKVLLSLSIEAIFAAVVAAIIFLVWHDHKRRILAFGVICDLFSIIMYGSPLTIMKKVITTKSVKCMPFYLSLANFLNGCIWSAYALIEFDVFIFISNGLGALSGAVQLILYGCYFRSTPTDESDGTDAKPTPYEIQLCGSDAAARV